MTTDTIGGVWTYSVELCKALDRFNVHFHLVTMGALMQPAQRAEIAGLRNVTVYETDFLLEWMETPWKSIDAAGKWLHEVHIVWTFRAQDCPKPQHAFSRLLTLHAH